MPQCLSLPALSVRTSRIGQPRCATSQQTMVRHCASLASFKLQGGLSHQLEHFYLWENTHLFHLCSSNSSRALLPGIWTLDMLNVLDGRLLEALTSLCDCLALSSRLCRSLTDALDRQRSAHTTTVLPGSQPIKRSYANLEMRPGQSTAIHLHA